MPRTIPALLLTFGVLLGPLTPTSSHAGDRWQTTMPRQENPRTDTVALLRDLDQRAAAAASARPTFSFPARIGFARIQDGVVTPIPSDEWTAWRILRDQMPPALGEFTPVSAIVAQSITTSPVSATPHDAITHLRLAAARERLDAILLYDVSTMHSLEQTELSLLDATIIGAWWFPVHKSHLAAHASATLIDVRSGLSCGSAIGNASDVCSAALLGSEEKLARQRATTVRKAVQALVSEVDALFIRLAQAPRPSTTRDGDAARATASPVRAPAPTVHDSQHDRIIPPPIEGDDDSFWNAR